MISTETGEVWCFEAYGSNLAGKNGSTEFYIDIEARLSEIRTCYRRGLRLC
jgi:hypothetical protein